ncbi:uncharacterized protein LOC123006561 [Tribolium madens]|uniref:uncharacterized protein LOC123006561 n=1 Tax=Tribolium madens TaxID=41895 RepID=UPI001CF738E6|nr:uncharacterized protein LOC123006561 [Tribolium madens]XP_044257075.1 uncharacterized protein LOC123006561 [Tribolium madens]
MSNKKTLNIVVIGETGVGKSTFINMFPTYFRYDNIDKAVEDFENSVVIPTVVTIYDEDGKDHEYEIGTDNDKIQEAGCSGTQTVKSYFFECEESDFNINLVDTPGMGDQNGVIADNEHCEMILNHLRDLDEIHAFCFLMRPTNTRNTVFFEYCMKEIMSRLHKSACQNIIFIFSNTRSQDYGPGDTLPGLRRMICAINEKLTDVEIKLHTNTNIFCFDNESIKYLVAKHNNVNLKTCTMNYYKQSWDVSKDEFLRLFEYVGNLEPHDVKNSVSLNKTRGLISAILKPLSDLSDLLKENIQNLNKNEEKIREARKRKEELEDKLYITETDLEIIQFEKPSNICTNSSCATLETRSDGVQKWNFNKSCHEECTWVGNLIKEESIGHWGLRYCSVIRLWDGTCKKCECSLSDHMIIFYGTKKHQKKVLVTDVKKELDSTESKIDTFERYIQQVLQRKQKLQNDLDFMTKCAAKFAVFIKNNAITSVNDAYEGYMDLLIKRAEYEGDSERIKDLKGILEKHMELKKYFEASDSLTDCSVTSQSIEDDIQKLFNCKYVGPKIKEIYEKKNKCIINAKESDSKMKIISGIFLRMKKIKNKAFSLGTYIFGSKDGPNESAEPATEATEESLL